MMTFITVVAVILTLIHMISCLIAVSVMSKDGWIKKHLENDGAQWRRTVASYTRAFPRPIPSFAFLIISSMLGVVAYIGGGWILALAALAAYSRVPIAVKEFIEWR